MEAIRYLLIGAGGLVGSHLLRALAGRDVVATYRREFVPGARTLDITDSGAVVDAVLTTRPTVVLLAAADAYVERCEREPEATRRVNVDGTRHVARAAAMLGAMLVIFSSEYVFDGTLGSYDEEEPVRPLNEYGRQKVEAEAIARDVSGHLICRTSGVFGGDARRKNFVLQLVDALRAGRTFDVPTDQLVTPSYAPDLATAVVGLIDRNLSGTFNVAGPQVLPRLDFAERVVSTFRLDGSLLRPKPTLALGLVAKRPSRAGLSDAKLQSVLNQRLSPVDDALRALVPAV